MRFCPTCDRLFDNYNAAIQRADERGALVALQDYDAHRVSAHPRSEP